MTGTMKVKLFLLYFFFVHLRPRSLTHGIKCHTGKKSFLEISSVGDTVVFRVYV